MKTNRKESDGSLPLAKFLKLFQLIAYLKAGRFTINQLVERFDSSKSSMYRYLALLEEVGICLEKDFNNRYFIATAQDNPSYAQFIVDEIGRMRERVRSSGE